MNTQVFVEELHQVAEEFKLPRRTPIERDNILLETIVRLRKLPISGFYGDRVPTFKQGMPTHELQDLVTAEEVTGYIRKCEELQAKIDALILEYCPDEMTEEQLRIWSESQKTVSKETESAVEEALRRT